MMYWWLAIVFYIVLGLGQQTSEGLCIFCPPSHIIDISTIDELVRHSVHGGVSIELDWQTQTLYVIRDPRLAPLANDETDAILASTPNQVLGMQENYNIEFGEAYWDTYYNFSTDLGSDLSQPIILMASHPLSNVVAFAGSSGNIIFWNGEEHQILHSIQLVDALVTDIAFHPTDELLMVVDNEQRGIYILEAETIQALNLPIETQHISNISFNTTGSFLVAGLNTTVAFWHSTDELDFVDTFPIEDDLQYVLFHPQDNETLFTFAQETVTRWIWNGVDLQEAFRFDVPPLETTDPVVTSTAFSPDGSVLIAIYNQYDVVVWNTATGAILDVPALSMLQSPIDDPRPIYSLAFSSDGLWLAVGTGFGLVFLIVP